MIDLPHQNLEHPRSHVMESIGWFYDHKDRKNVLAHQTATTGIYDLVTERLYQLLMRLYRKRGDAGSGRHLGSRRNCLILRRGA
ncbi:MAG: hypothetical protein QXU18_00040 [Thermoplasmatales archaeon]